MIDFKQVVKDTFENGGYSEKAEGRYMVALAGFEEIVPEEEFTAEVLEEYYLNHTGIGFIGTWLNEGKVYLDVSISLNDKERALQKAQKNEQLAIFDTKEMKEIML